jgi:tetratricopeptide (TPR) repeat protein
VDPSAYSAEQLSLARHYLMMEDRSASMEASRRVLSVDPDNDEAKEMLSQAQGDVAPSPQSTPGPPAATSELGGQAPAADQPLDDEDLLAFDMDALEDASDPPMAPEPMATELPPMAEAPVAPADGDSADERIATLLAQGDEQEAQGDLQGAIQIWSRVFILEDSNADAEQRVDRARRALEEQGHRVDEIRFRAEDLVKAGNFAEARDEYQKVLEILPNHREAKEALQQIEAQLAGGAEDTQAAGDEGEEIQAVPLAPPEEPQESAPEELEPEEPVLLEPQPETPPPAPEVAVPAVGQAPARSGPGRGLVLSMLVVGVVVLGGAAYFGWHILFPSGPSGELQALEPQPLDRTSAAPAPAPAPAEPSADAAVPEPVVADEPAVSPQRQAALSDAEASALSKEVVQEGKRLFDNGDYVNALVQFREALDLDPGNLDAKDWETKTASEVGRREAFGREIATIRTAFSDYDYESALKKLYRMDPPTEDAGAMVHRWTVICWYNWGVMRLQGSRLREAEEKFQEVLGLQPDDEEAANHLEVVRRYRSRSTDPTFKSYASRLTLRVLD